MRELKCPLFSFKIAWTGLDFSCTVQAINYSVSIDWSRKNTGKKKVTTEERKLQTIGSEWLMAMVEISVEFRICPKNKFSFLVQLVKSLCTVAVRCGAPNWILNLIEYWRWEIIREWMATQQTPSRLLGIVQNPCDCQYILNTEHWHVCGILCGMRQVPERSRSKGPSSFRFPAARARKNIKSLTFYNFWMRKTVGVYKTNKTAGMNPSMGLNGMHNTHHIILYILSSKIETIDSFDWFL